MSFFDSTNSAYWSDTFEQFINEGCFTDPDDSVSAIILYNGYKEWCEHNDAHAVMTQDELSKCMIDKGYDQPKSSSMRYYGIALAVAELEEL